MREREHLCALRVSGNVLLMETMHWPEEIREADFEELGKRPNVQDRERNVARQLIRQLAGELNPAQFEDEYHNALKNLIRKKVKCAWRSAPANLRYEGARKWISTNLSPLSGA